MSRVIITVSRTIFIRLLAHAPEDLQREAKEGALRAIPALCFTEDDIRERFAQEELWDRLSEDEQREAIQSLMDAGEYDPASKLANESITEAVARYVHDAMIEKEERRGSAGIGMIANVTSKRSPEKRLNGQLVFTARSTR